MQERRFINPHDAASVSAAYAAGRLGIGAHYCRAREVREAIASWTAAEASHAECSFFGAENVRKSRAYFLGIARYWRSGDGSRFLAGLS